MSELNIREIVETWAGQSGDTIKVEDLIHELEQAIENNQAEWKEQPRGSVLLGIKEFKEYYESKAELEVARATINQQHNIAKHLEAQLKQAEQARENARAEGYKAGHKISDEARQHQAKSMQATQQGLVQQIRDYRNKIKELESGFDPAQIFEWEFRFEVKESETEWDKKQGKFRAIAHNLHNSDGRLGYGDTELKAVYALYDHIATWAGGFERFKLVGDVSGSRVEMTYNKPEETEGGGRVMEALKGIPTEKGLIVFMDLGKTWEGTNHNIVTGYIVEESVVGPYIRIEDFVFDWSKNDEQLYYTNIGSGGIDGFDLPMGSMYWVSPSIEQYVFEGGRPGHEIYMLDKDGQRITEPCKKLTLLELRRYLNFHLKEIFDHSEEAEETLIWCSQCESRVYASWTYYPCLHLEWCDDCCEWQEIGSKEVCNHLKGQQAESIE